MGWWWSSSPAKDTPNNASPAKTPSEPAIPDAPQPKKLTPDEQADLEFRQLLADLQSAEESGSKTSTLSQLQANGSTSSPDQPTSSIAPESLYPDTMSCRNAFDYAFFCQSFGGQFVNVYRHGELRSCSEHWDNFWMCMRTRGWSDELRKKAIRAHNQKKAIKYKTGPSSEDIWDVRLEPAKDSFQGDFAALEREMKEEELKQQGSV